MQPPQTEVQAGGRGLRDPELLKRFCDPESDKRKTGLRYLFINDAQTLDHIASDSEQHQRAQDRPIQPVVPDVRLVPSSAQHKPRATGQHRKPAAVQDRFVDGKINPFVKERIIRFAA